MVCSGFSSCVLQEGCVVLFWTKGKPVRFPYFQDNSHHIPKFCCEMKQLGKRVTADTILKLF